MEQLKAILDACSSDDFLRPIVVTGICTAMRRGDCCLLRWDAVDLEGGFLSVKTAKTGEMADIPIMPPLAEELRKAKEANDPSEYCFPEAALMYRSNPDGITWRVKQLLARALEPEGMERGSLAENAPEAVRTRVMAYLDRKGASNRTTRLREVFVKYMDGGTLETVMEATGCSRGTVSNYLNELERETGCAIVRARQRALKTDGLQLDRGEGRRRASIHDFHSFRVTWITLALAAGVPLELVQRVTGHRTTAVVMKHYFRPGREDFRTALLSAMPKMLSEQGPKSVKDEVKGILTGMTARTWKADRAKLLELVERL